MMIHDEQKAGGYVSTKRFLLDHPHPNWLIIIKACLKVSERIRGDSFAGAWVLSKAKQIGDVNWFPNLRPLVSAGILKRIETARGGKRAYYLFLDRDGVKEAIKEITTEE